MLDRLFFFSFVFFFGVKIALYTFFILAIFEGSFCFMTLKILQEAVLLCISTTNSTWYDFSLEGYLCQQNTLEIYDYENHILLLTPT